MAKFWIYKSKREDGRFRVAIVPNNYLNTLQYVMETLELAKTWGLTIPKPSEIKLEILAGERHARKLSIEFISETEPIENNTTYVYDLDLYPHLYRDISTP